MTTRWTAPRGCLFGQVIGDNLGALVEFEDEERDRPPLPRTAFATFSDGGNVGHSGRAGDGRQRACARPRAHAHRDEALRP